MKQFQKEREDTDRWLKKEMSKERTKDRLIDEILILGRKLVKDRMRVFWLDNKKIDKHRQGYKNLHLRFSISILASSS